MRSRAILVFLGLFLLVPHARAQGGARVAPGEPAVRNVAVLLYPGVELLDFAGPSEVFSAASAEDGRRFRVYTVAESAEPLVSQGCVTIVPEFTIADCPRPDLIVVPGGAVPLARPALVAWVQSSAAQAEVALSVCNGALLFARAGLLDGLEATTHHGSIESLTLSSPTTSVRPERRFVDNGRVVTTAGVSAGIDGALHVVARLLGHEAAERTAYYMEYRWDPEGAEEYHRRVIAGGGPSVTLELVRVALAQGVEAALAERAAMAEPPSEQEVNLAGYALLQSGRSAEALRVFELNAAAFPASANAWDSLADACMALGREAEALAHTHKCLALLDADSGLEPVFRERVRASALEKQARVEAGATSAAWMCPPCPVDCHQRAYQGPGICGECGMVLIREAEYRLRSATSGSAAGAPRSASAAQTSAALIADLQAGRLLPETLLAEPEAAGSLRDPSVRHELRAWLREHAALGKLALVTAEEPGERLLLRVRMVDPESGSPLPGALVHVYQTDAQGVYADEGSGGADNPRLFGYVLSDANGELVLRTIVPGGYPGSGVPRHVHLEVRAAGRAAALREVLFADDPRLTEEARRESEESGWPVVTLRAAPAGGREGSVVLAAGERVSSGG